jgi:hypothetical protein
MSVILEISVSAEDFVLGQTLEADADITVRLERVVPLEKGSVPYFRIQNDDLDEIERRRLRRLFDDEDGNDSSARLADVWNRFLAYEFGVFRTFDRQYDRFE